MLVATLFSLAGCGDPAQNSLNQLNQKTVSASVTDSTFAWYNSTNGSVYGMTANGSSITGGALFWQEPNLSWSIVGQGDFNGDGIRDLVWWNSSTGQVYIMLMSSATIVKSGMVVYTESNTNWRIVATGDINGDGKSDLIWWNKLTGQAYAMLLNGTTVTGGAVIYTEPNTAWKSVAAADFNGNGKAELLWWNSTTGQVAIGQTNGLNASTAGIIYTEPNTNWRIAGTGDLDGDGKAEIIWHNKTTGQVYGMQTNGSSVTNGAMMYTEPNTFWEIVSVGNYNSDNKAELLWWNQQTGQVYLMPMNGLSTAPGATLLYTEPNTIWHIQGETEWRDKVYGKGVTTTTSTTAIPPPVKLSITKLNADPGANYAGVAYPQTFTVKVTDQSGLPVNNQTVNWSADSGGWPIPAVTVTGANGQASVYWVPGSSSPPTLTATVANSQGTANVSYTGALKNWATRPDHLATSYIEYFPVATGISRDVTPLTDQTGTYYAAINWDNGYTGIQRGGSYYDRQIQFSVWNYNSLPSSIVNAGTSICQDFSHEGSGVMCSNTYPWVVGKTYRFEMTTVASSSSTTDITVTFIDVASNTKKFIATLRQNGTPDLTWALSFVEDFILNDMSCMTVAERRAIYGNTKYLVNSTWLNTSHSGTYMPWNPTLYCANQGYVVRSNGIEMGVGGTFKANSISTSIPVSY